MPDTRPFRLVDAFAERPFRGNVAGVVFDADDLTDAQMQQIAAEINASETAFISRTNDLHRSPRLRWFTPAAEVGFCGHATLGATHAFWEAGYVGDAATVPSTDPVFETAVGELRLTGETISEPDHALIWWLQMPDPGLEPERSNPLRTCELLGMTTADLDPGVPPMRTRHGHAIYFIRNWQTLMDLKPRFDELAAWSRRVDVHGYCVATTETLTDSIDVHSRYFAPALGVNEDPVTGSVHGALATLLVVHGHVGSAGGRSALMCAQGRAGGRSGLIRALVEPTPEGYRTLIGGRCFTTLVGEISIPPK
jgi:trans-2,3-dihydro-3-hydroxyanthranilate isomerase